jgi:hypothetical protein
MPAFSRPPANSTSYIFWVYFASKRYFRRLDGVFDMQAPDDRNHYLESYAAVLKARGDGAAPFIV